jgi:glycine hydroxymethyltransferase
MYYDTVFYRYSSQIAPPIIYFTWVFTAMCCIVIISVDPDSGLIDYDKAHSIAISARPRVIVAGASSYPRLIDYERMRSIADSVGAYLVADIAHVAGLFVGEVSQQRYRHAQLDGDVTPNDLGSMVSMLERRFNPFEHSHVVTTTTQKTLRGPRAAMILYDRNAVSSAPLNSAVFPALQGGPNNAAIAATAVALGEAMTSDFAKYIPNVRRNAAVLASQLAARGHCVVTNGTDNHIVMLHLGSIPSATCKCHLSGEKVEKLLELCGIYANKNVVPQSVCHATLPPPPGARSSVSLTTPSSSAAAVATAPSVITAGSPDATCSRPAATSVAPLGLRLGTAALTTRFPTASETDMRALADIIHDAIMFAQEACSSASGNTIAAFLESLERPLMVVSLLRLKTRVSSFVARFPFPSNISYTFA